MKNKNRTLSIKSEYWHRLDTAMSLGIARLSLMKALKVYGTLCLIMLSIIMEFADHGDLFQKITQKT